MKHVSRARDKVRVLNRRKMTARRTDEAHRRATTDLFMLAASGLLLIFSLWSLYFDQTAQNMLRTLRTTITHGTAITSSSLPLRTSAPDRPSPSTPSAAMHASANFSRAWLSAYHLLFGFVTVWWLHVRPQL
jgi:hypothetical protein